MIAAMLITLAALIIIGVPIAIALGVAATIALYFFGGYPLALVTQKIFAISHEFTLLAIPMFILSGQLMDAGGISNQLVRAVSAVLGAVRGGLGAVSVVTAMLFAGVSGSAVADAAAVGSIVIKPMKERGYGADFSACLVGAAGVIGPIIPPSIPFIIYGVMTSTSIAELFLAGAIPGILIGIALIVVNYLTAVKRNFPREPRLPFKQMIVDVLRAVPALLMLVIILGGILGGIFTATEASVAAVVYALLIGRFVYRKLTFHSVVIAIQKATDSTIKVMWLIACASLLSWILTSENVPDVVAAFLLSLSSNKLVLLILVAVLYLLVGMVIDLAPAMVMLVPVLLPALIKVGVDPIHFGVITVVGLAAGLVTPPTAPTLMVTASIAEIPLRLAFRRIGPMLLALVVVLFLCVFFPGLSLWLPGFMR